MATLRKKQMLVGQLTGLLNEMLDYAIESNCKNIPRIEVLNESADQLLKISKKVADLKEICEMNDEEIKKVMVCVWKEWDRKRDEEFQEWLNKEE